MNKKLSIILLILCFGNIFGFAQTAKEKTVPTGLTLEINFYKGNPPSYQAIYESAANSKWSWFALFRRVPNFQNSADLPFVRAVKFEWYLEKDTVKINVSVLSGQPHNDEKNVGAYTLRENERTTIKELTNFGVEPFEIAVIRVAPSVSFLPSVENKTNSLQVSGIEPQATTLPSYKINLQNNSNKTVEAVSFEILVDGESALSGGIQNDNDKPLAEPGGTFEKLMPSILEHKKIASGEVPPIQPNQTVLIKSVTFTDGSFEGDSFTAARIRAYALGRKLQLKQIISLIEMSDNNQKQLDSHKLAEQAQNLKPSVDESQFNELLKNFPNLTEKEKSSIRYCVEAASQQIKTAFVKELEMRLQDSGSIDDWLKDTKKDYQNWLNRIL